MPGHMEDHRKNRTEEIEQGLWRPLDRVSIDDTLNSYKLDYSINTDTTAKMDIPLPFSSVQFSRSSCPTLCNLMNRSTPGLPVHHQLPEFTETHVHQVSDAIQPSHPLSSPSPPAPNPSQHHGLSQ